MVSLMGGGTRRLVFVHEHKAAYPEIAAYKQHFANRFTVTEMTPGEARAEAARDRAIFWHMMGFYPTRPRSGFVIHDYRSLSVGFGRKLIADARWR